MSSAATEKPDLGTHTEKKPAGARNGKFLAAAFNKTLTVRIIIAAVLLAVSCLTADSKALTVILRVMSVVISACDILYDSVLSVGEGKFLNSPLIYVTVVMVSMLTGNTAEGALVCIVFQLGKKLSVFVSNRLKEKALSRIREGEAKSVLNEVLEYPSAPDIPIKDSVEKTFYPLLMIIIVIGLLYLIILPLAAHLNISIALRRSLAIVLLAEPAVLCGSFRCLGIKGLCLSAKSGVVLNSAIGLTDTTGKYVVHAEQKTNDYIGVSSRTMERESFINFAVHVLCKSKHKFAKFIINYYNMDYDAELVTDCIDVEGGVEGSIRGMTVLFGNYGMLSDYGISVDNPVPGRFYMYLGGRYVGSMYIEYGMSAETGLLELGRKVDTFAVENASMIFIIKSVQILLAFTGYCSIFAAASVALISNLAAMLNSKRLDNELTGFDLIFSKYFDNV